MKFDRKYVSYTARSNHDLTRPEYLRRLLVTQILGGHKRWQALDERTLLALGEESGGSSK